MAVVTQRGCGPYPAPGRTVITWPWPSMLRNRGRWSADEIIAMFREMSEVGSVELKMTLPPEQRLALTGLKVDFLQGRIREGVLLPYTGFWACSNRAWRSARRTQGAPDHTVVKLRPAAAPRLSGELPHLSRTSRWRWTSRRVLVRGVRVGSKASVPRAVRRVT